MSRVRPGNVDHSVWQWPLNRFQTNNINLHKPRFTGTVNFGVLTEATTPKLAFAVNEIWYCASCHN